MADDKSNFAEFLDRLNLVSSGDVKIIWLLLITC